MKIVLSALWASSIVAVAGCVGVNTRMLLLSSGSWNKYAFIYLLRKKFKWHHGPLKLKKAGVFFFLAWETVLLEV